MDARVIWRRRRRLRTAVAGLRGRKGLCFRLEAQNVRPFPPFPPLCFGHTQDRQVLTANGTNGGRSSARAGAATRPNESRKGGLKQLPSPLSHLLASAPDPVLVALLLICDLLQCQKAAVDLYLPLASSSANLADIVHAVLSSEMLKLRISSSTAVAAK
jgi:hypothetical protein